MRNDKDINSKVKFCSSKTSGLTIAILAELEKTLSKITESEFREYAKNNAIKTAQIISTDEGFIFVVELTWKDGKQTLYSFRNRPRAWVSLDRLLAYLKKHQLNVTEITLLL